MWPRGRLYQLSSLFEWQWQVLNQQVYNQLLREKENSTKYDQSHLKRALLDKAIVRSALYVLVSMYVCTHGKLVHLS